MSRFPSITGKQLVKILGSRGFTKIRQKGSHCFLRHKDGRVTVVPVHGGETIGGGLLRKILRDTDLSKEEIFGK